MQKKIIVMLFMVFSVTYLGAGQCLSGSKNKVVPVQNTAPQIVVPNGVPVQQTVQPMVIEGQSNEMLVQRISELQIKMVTIEQNMKEAIEQGMKEAIKNELKDLNIVLQEQKNKTPMTSAMELVTLINALDTDITHIKDFTIKYGAEMDKVLAAFKDVQEKVDSLRAESGDSDAKKAVALLEKYGPMVEKIFHMLDEVSK